MSTKPLFHYKVCNVYDVMFFTMSGRQFCYIILLHFHNNTTIFHTLGSNNVCWSSVHAYAALHKQGWAMFVTAYSHFTRSVWPTPSKCKKTTVKLQINQCAITPRCIFFIIRPSYLIKTFVHLCIVGVKFNIFS